ncbi:MAG: hypothetical protein PHO27_04475 [Sulfuricurvum sp.]|nr:hypothetical protein [Sulfuricurvum sp.]
MKILLFNDNPVVRKLVTLSAQKTKDEVSVVWSTDEIEESEYDLLILDDALYSDGTFDILKETIIFKRALLMATRGKAVPAGFDHVINKPFLPTDLVEVLIQISKSIEAQGSKPQVPLVEKEEPFFAINLEDTLPEVEQINKDSLNMDHLDDFDDDFDLGDLDEGFNDEMPINGILDKEEVQEVKGLLDDTDNDVMLDEEVLVKDINDLDFEDMDEDKIPLDTVEKALDDEVEEEFDFGDFDFDDKKLEVSKEMPLELDIDDSDSAKESLTSKEDTEDFDFGDLDFDDDESLAKDLLLPESGISNKADEEEFDFGDFDFNDEKIETTEENEAISDQDDSDVLLNDDEFEDLELQIQDAVDELEPEDLEMEVDENIAEAFKPDIENDFDLEGFDELDMLNERELKIAIGEEVEDEIDPYQDDELENILDETKEDEEETLALEPAKEEKIEVNSTHAEGVEALQALLKALSNEDVAKSLKGLNISININFGNEQ